MPQLPYQSQVPVGGGAQQPYAQPVGVSNAVGAGLTNLAGGIEKTADTQMREQQLHDEAAVNDVYATKFSPALRSLLYDPQKGFFAKQGADAVSAWPQVQGVAEQLRTQSRDDLQNENQQKLFDAMSRRHIDVELDAGARHVQRERQVWDARTSDAVVSDKVNNAVLHFNDPEYVNGAIAGGLFEINKYGADHGQSAEQTAQRATEFVRQTRSAIVQRLLTQDPIAAQAYMREHAGELAGPQMPVLEHQVSSAVKPVEAAAAAREIVSNAQNDRLNAGMALDAQKGDFGSALQFVLSREGGYSASDGNSGAPVKYGINQKANPDVDVKSLTLDKATQIYKDRYWNAIGGDSLPRPVAMMAMDAAVNQGVDFAKKLVADSGGDVAKMAQLRKDRYEQIIANDPSQAKFRDNWMARVDAAQQAAQASPQTTSRDIRAQMGDLITQAEQRAEQLHPGDPMFRELLVSHVKGQLSNAVASQQAVQDQAHSVITNLALGTGAGSARPTSLDDLMAMPGARAAWAVLPPESQKGVLGMIEHNQRAAIGVPTKSDPAAVQDLFNRIHLPDDDPNKVNYRQQLSPYFGAGGPGSGKINREDYDWLSRELDQQQSVSGRSLTKDLQTARITARSMLLNSNIGSIQKEAAEEAAYRFSNDLQGKVDAAVKVGKDPRQLLVPGSPDYVLDPKRVMSFLQSPALAVAQQAKAIRESTGKIAEAPVRVASDAEYTALASGTTFIGPDGKTRVKP